VFLHFQLDYWWNAVRRIWNARHWPGRRRLLFRLLVVVPALYGIHSVFFFLDKLVFPGLWSQKIEKPIFIVGHARSGTTLIHRLLAADADRFSYFLYWEMFFPSLIEKKLIRALGVLDRRLLGDFFLSKLEAWDEKTFGAFRHMHEMGLWVPEEDDFVMSTTFCSAYWHLPAPLMDINDVFYLDQKPARFRARVMRSYRECVRRQLYLNGGDKTHLSKNPVYCGRVATLLEAFPDARIVVNVRNPIECVPSNHKLMEANFRGRGWKQEDFAASLDVLEAMAYDCFHNPRQVLAAHPGTPQLAVDYRELIAHPRATIEKLYQTFGLPISTAYAETLAAQDAKSRQHKSRHSYSAEEFGIDTDRMRRELEEFYREYGWDEPAA
jgi:hypothetical protein